MIITDSIRESLGKGWTRLFGPWIENSGEMEKIFGELRSRKGKGIRTAPDSKDVFRAFQLCQPDRLQVIICGISPYHTWAKVNGEEVCIADGLCMSCSKTQKTSGLQPSLDQWYNAYEMESNNGAMNPLAIRDGDLSFLAHQGVLLYNIGLTVQESKPCSDNELWSAFNREFWRIITDYSRGLVIVLLGEQAHKSAALINPLQHYIIKLSHPASASHKGVTWSSDGMFKTVDKILKDNNNAQIIWSFDLPF